MAVCLGRGQAERQYESTSGRWLLPYCCVTAAATGPSAEAAAAAAAAAAAVVAAAGTAGSGGGGGGTAALAAAAVATSDITSPSSSHEPKDSYCKHFIATRAARPAVILGWQRFKVYGCT